MKLELKHLVPYFPYSLMCLTPIQTTVSGQAVNCGPILLSGLFKDYARFHVKLDYADLRFDDVTPILRPLSYLTKEIEHGGEKFDPIRCIRDDKDIRWYEYDKFSNDYISGFEDYGILSHNYRIIDKLFQWHFDVFGLIEEDLAIDVNGIQ